MENKRRPDLAASSDPDDASVYRSSIVRCQRFSRLDLHFCPAPHRALNIVSPYRLAIRPFWDRPMPILPHSSFFRHSSVRIRTVSPNSRHRSHGAHAALIGGYAPRFPLSSAYLSTTTYINPIALPITHPQPHFPPP